MRIVPICVLALSALLTTGCYFQDVEANEIGIETNRGEVTDIKGQGGHQNFSPFAELHKIEVSAKNLEWSDPDLVTRDKQPIGVALAVTYARKIDRDSVILMWNKYNAQARDDNSLQTIVSSRVPAIAKTVTARYSLDELLGTATGESEDVGRSRVQQDLFTLMAPELAEIGVELLDIRVSNFSPDPQYLELLRDKAQVGLEREIAQQRTLQLQEQLKQEQAETSIELERARRQNEVNQELAKSYDTSDRYYELERLRLLREVIGRTDKLYFIPQGTDLSLILGGQAPALPIQTTDGSAPETTPEPSPEPSTP